MRTLSLLGKKKGMTRVFDEKGNLIPCTVIHLEPNVVTQVKKKETDGYEAVQLGAFLVSAPKKRRVSKPLQGHFCKAGVEPYRQLCESQMGDISQFAPGQEVGVNYLSDAPFVDVTGVSKGRGCQGGMRRHNFSGGRATHGSGFHRHTGSTGQRSTPGRTFPGRKMAGHMGAEQVTVQNLEVVRIDVERQLLLVRGAVPGPVGAVVCVKRSVKRPGRR